MRHISREHSHRGAISQAHQQSSVGSHTLRNAFYILVADSRQAHRLSQGRQFAGPLLTRRPSAQEREVTNFNGSQEGSKQRQSLHPTPKLTGDASGGHQQVARKDRRIDIHVQADAHNGVVATMG